MHVCALSPRGAAGDVAHAAAPAAGMSLHSSFGRVSAAITPIVSELLLARGTRVLFLCTWERACVRGCVCVCVRACV